MLGPKMLTPFGIIGTTHEGQCIMNEQAEIKATEQDLYHSQLLCPRRKGRIESEYICNDFGNVYENLLLN